MFIVDRDTAGVSIGKTEELMGRHCSSLDEIIFEDVKVPEENLLIPAGGTGFKAMMNEFNSERCGNSAFAKSGFNSANRFQIFRGFAGLWLKWPSRSRPPVF
jgi:alkylation response protein AidB-like acyl-CoA dehydrogenase